MRTSGTAASVRNTRPLNVAARSIVQRFLALDERTAYAAAIGAATLVILIGVALSGALNIWMDEAFTLHTTGSGPLSAWTQAIRFEGQPPLYFVLEALWRSIDETSIAFARFPSTVYAAAAAAVIVLTAHRIAPRLPATVVALVTALNPLVIWAATELRVYALVLLIGAVLSWAFVAGFLADRPARTARGVYVLFAIAGLYTQYYIGFVLVAHVVTLMALRRPTMPGLMGCLTIVACAFAPFSGVVLMHVTGSGDFVVKTSVIHAAHELINVVFAVVLPHDLTWSRSTKLIGTAAAIILVLVLCLFGRPRVPTGVERGFVLQWALSFGLFSCMFGVTGLPLDTLRHAIVLAPSSLLAALLLIASLKRMRRRAGAAACAVFAVFAIAQYGSQYQPPIGKVGEWKRVAETLTTGNPAAPVFVFPAELALPLSWYLARPTVPIPRPIPFTTDYVAASTLHDRSEVSRVFTAAKAQTTIWVVTPGECPAVEPAIYNYHCRYLEAYLAQHYRLARSVRFRGSLARLFTNETVPLDQKGRTGA